MSRYASNVAHGCLFFVVLLIMGGLALQSQFVAMGALAIGGLLGYAAGVLSLPVDDSGPANPPGTQSERDY